MSDSGNFDFDAGQQQPSNQPAPGWYFAQGDPPGTERYWNGSSWEGTYRAVGGFSPSTVMAPPSGAVPTGVKVLAWTITVLKLLPLLLVALLGALLSSESIRADIETEADVDLDDINSLVYIIGGIMLVVGIVLLIGQIRAVMKQQVNQAVIWAGVMVVVDVIYLGITVPSGDAFSTVLAAAILIAQGVLFAWLWQLRKTPAV